MQKSQKQQKRTLITYTHNTHHPTNDARAKAQKSPHTQHTQHTPHIGEKRAQCKTTTHSHTLITHAHYCPKFEVQRREDQSTPSPSKETGNASPQRQMDKMAGRQRFTPPTHPTSHKKKKKKLHEHPPHTHTHTHTHPTKSPSN
jgi:hypothetical protein